MIIAKPYPCGPKRAKVIGAESGVLLMLNPVRGHADNPIMSRAETRMEQAAMEMIGAITRAKADWLDAQMKLLMPPEIYDLAQTTIVVKGHVGRNRAEIAKWLSANKVRILEGIKEEGDEPVIALGEIPSVLPPATTRTRLMHDDRPVSDFVIRYSEGKCECMVKNYKPSNETPTAA